MTSPPRYCGQRLLCALIRYYRGRVSGRGPLRKVRCTFAHTESCSAYGLRAAEQLAHTMPEAMRLIFGRIRRCGRTSLFRLPATNPGRPALVWGEAYDASPDDHDATLRATGELDSTRAAVLRAHAAVAHARGDIPALRTSRALATQLAGRPAPVVVRSASAVIPGLRRRLARRLCLAAVLMAGAVLALPSWAALLVTLAVVVLALQWTRVHARRKQRFDQLAAAADFRRPVRG